MPCGVGILRTEGRPECIDITECLRIRLSVQLTAHGKACLLPEEILAVIHAALLRLRRFLHIQRGHPEHLPGAFTVASRDQRRMHIDKSSLLKELMKRVSRQRAHPEYCLKCVRPRPKM